MNGARPPARTEDSCDPSEAPVYRTRVPKRQAKNAACGPHRRVAERETHRVSASHTSVRSRVDEPNSGNASTAAAMAPIKHTGRRLIRSDSAAAGVSRSVDARADQHAGQHRSSIESRVLRGVQQDEDAVDVERAVLGRAGADGDQHLARVAPQDVDDRQARFAGVALHPGERRRFEQPQADDESDRHEQAAQQERHAPTPAQELRFRQARDDREHGRRQQQAGRHANLRPAAVKTAAVRGRVLDGHQDGSAPFAANAEALRQAQHDQGDRGPGAGLVVGRQHADEHGRDAHHHQRQHEHGLAADAVAERPMIDAANGRPEN